MGEKSYSVRKETTGRNAKFRNSLSRIINNETLLSSDIHFAQFRQLPGGSKTLPTANSSAVIPTVTKNTGAGLGQGNYKLSTVN